MYEPPRLNRVGDAEDVILGTIATGNDIDLQFVTGDMEWADEGEE